jgi:universal stress protein E
MGMKRFNNILYVSESSTLQNAAISRAVSLAQNNQADLTFVDVIPAVPADIYMPPGGPLPNDLQQAMTAECRQTLESLITPYEQRRFDVLVGRKYEEVIRAVLRNGYDLVIKPAENPGYIERLFGSDDMHLLRKCPCPVWLMKPEEKSNYECIVAAVDIDANDSGSDKPTLNTEILELASSLALSDFAALHVIHVWDAPQAGFVGIWADNSNAAEMSITEGERRRHQTGMDYLTRKLREQIGAEAYDYLSPRVHLHMGEAKHVIPEAVRDLNADLVVMGTVARTGIPGLLIGNTAEAILDQLTCSVLAVKPPGYVCPLK